MTKISINTRYRLFIDASTSIRLLFQFLAGC